MLGQKIWVHTGKLTCRLPNYNVNRLLISDNFSCGHTIVRSDGSQYHSSNTITLTETKVQELCPSSPPPTTPTQPPPPPPTTSAPTPQAPPPPPPPSTPASGN